MRIEYDVPRDLAPLLMVMATWPETMELTRHPNRRQRSVAEDFLTWHTLDKLWIWEPLHPLWRTLDVS